MIAWGWLWFGWKEQERVVAQSGTRCLFMGCLVQTHSSLWFNVITCNHNTSSRVLFQPFVLSVSTCSSCSVKQEASLPWKLMASSAGRLRKIEWVMRFLVGYTEPLWGTLQSLAIKSVVLPCLPDCMLMWWCLLLWGLSLEWPCPYPQDQGSRALLFGQHQWVDHLWNYPKESCLLALNFLFCFRLFCLLLGCSSCYWVAHSVERKQVCCGVHAHRLSQLWRWVASGDTPSSSSPLFFYKDKGWLFGFCCSPM